MYRSAAGVGGLFLNVVLESEGGGIEVSISSSSLLSFNKNLLIVTPTRVYIADLESSNSRAIGSAYALSAEPPNPFGHYDFALLAKEIKEAFWSSRDAIKAARG